MGDQIKILILEDNASDARLIKRELVKFGLKFSSQLAQDKKSFIAELDSSTPDLILSDFSLPGFDGISALSLARQRFPRIPMVIVSGAIGEETAIETLKAGATDYVLKQRLNRIGPVVERALQEAQQVAERQKVEQALHESEERFRLLIEEVQDYAILLLDPEGQITSWNQGAERIKGWSAEEVIGKHFSMFYLPQAQEMGEPQQALEIAAAHGRFEVQGQRLRKDGSTFWADIAMTALHTPDGRLRGFAKITRDVTKRKEAERAIFRAKEEWETTFDCIPDLISILDNDQHILRANHAMAERVGMGVEEMIGSLCFQCMHADNKRPNFCPHPLTLADGQQHFAEVYEPRLGGYFLVSTTPLRNSQGQVNGIVHVAREITDLKHMEEALELANDNLEQRVRERTAELADANEELKQAALREQQMRVRLIQSEKYAALSRLVASVAHEVNNPLQTIQNCMFLLSNPDLAKRENAEEMISIAVSESKRVSKMVQQLRETYRPDRDNQPIIFNLIDIISNVHSLLEPQLHQKNVHWQVCYQNEKVLVLGMPDRIKQVCLNICLNAIDAMEENGGNLAVSLSIPDGSQKVTLAFQDTGCGIPGENIQRLFEPFFTTKDKGTGLGLAICYEIIHDHGGEISVESQSGQGTIFKVVLPLSDSYQ